MPLSHCLSSQGDEQAAHRWAGQEDLWQSHQAGAGVHGALHRWASRLWLAPHWKSDPGPPLALTRPLCLHSHHSGRHPGGDLRAGQADHRGAVGLLHLGSVQGEAMMLRLLLFLKSPLADCGFVPLPPQNSSHCPSVQCGDAWWHHVVMQEGTRPRWRRAGSSHGSPSGFSPPSLAGGMNAGQWASGGEGGACVRRRTSKSKDESKTLHVWACGEFSTGVFCVSIAADLSAGVWRAAGGAVASF